jgi:hypothetical protein
LLPEKGHQLAFAQLYIYDSVHEIENCHNVMQELDEKILQNLLNILDECNSYIQNFCYSMKDLIQTNVFNEIFMVIYANQIQDLRHYNTFTAFEVAAIMVGDGHKLHIANRNILLKMRASGNLNTIEQHIDLCWVG